MYDTLAVTMLVAGLVIILIAIYLLNNFFTSGKILGILGLLIMFASVVILIVGEHIQEDRCEYRGGDLIYKGKCYQLGEQIKI